MKLQNLKQDELQEFINDLHANMSPGSCDVLPHKDGVIFMAVSKAPGLVLTSKHFKDGKLRFPLYAAPSCTIDTTACTSLEGLHPYRNSLVNLTLKDCVYLKSLQGAIGLKSLMIQNCHQDIFKDVHKHVQAYFVHVQEISEYLHLIDLLRVKNRMGDPAHIIVRDDGNRTETDELLVQFIDDYDPAEHVIDTQEKLIELGLERYV